MRLFFFFCLICFCFQCNYTLNPFAAFRLSDVKTLEKLNFESWMEWKSSLQLILALMDSELALYEAKPPMPTRNSSPEERAKYEKWERSNRLSLMIMKHKISSSIRSLAPEPGTAGQYLARLEIMFMRFEKADAALLLNKLANMEYDGQGNVRDHIAKMWGLAARVKPGGMDIPNNFFVQLVLDSLPPQFKRFQATYVNWGLDELMCLCGEEEEFIRLENCERKISAIPVLGPNNEKKFHFLFTPGSCGLKKKAIQKKVIP